MSLTKRTTAALGHELMSELGSLRFCVVGCGGTGANFADLLVRTGGRQISLIDGGNVKASGLNRVLGFTLEDVGNPKVNVLKDRLNAIRPNGLEINAFCDSFRRPDQIMDNNPLGQRVRDEVHDADVVFAATDTNSSRLAIESLCRDKGQGILLCCGVEVDREAGVYKFECAWSPKTPPERENAAGYGPENASFASIVLEATSVAFTMLLSHLKPGGCPFRRYRRVYDANFVPVETIVE